MYYLTKFCCFCLKERENLRNLNNRDFWNINIVNKLMFCVKDDLDTSKTRTFICQKCCIKLEEAYEFKKMSLGNWNRFQGYIRKLKYVNPNCKTKYVLNEINILVSDVKLEGYEFKSACQDDDYWDGCFINEEPVETIESLLVEDKNNRTSEELNNVENRTEQLTDENVELSQDFYGETIKEEATIPDESLQLSCAVNFKCQVESTNCDEIFNTKWHLVRHIEEKHKKFQCSVCDRLFSVKQYLHKHMLMHENRRPFACSYCDRTFWIKHYLESHLKKQHRKLTDPDHVLSCYQCKAHFSSELKLKEHVLIHSDAKPYTCSTCGRGFKREQPYRQHLYIHNEKDRPYFDCPLCNKRYTTKASLKFHMLVHSNKQPHACRMCDARFFQKYSLKRHILKRHKHEFQETQECKKALNMLDENAESQVNCLKCDQIFNTKLHLEKHVQEKHTEFRCSLCNRCFHVKQYLRRHMRTHEDRRTFACTDCDRTFWRKNLLKEHVAKKHKNHADSNDSFSCYKCYEPFSSEFKLKEHVLIHSDAKPFTCSTCGRGFKREQPYRYHLYIHNEKNRPYFVCALCNKRFTAKSSLKLHLKGHSNKRPHACTMCDATFFKKKGLKNHILKCHNNSKKDFEETQECKKELHMDEEPVKSEPCDGFEFINIQDGNTPMQETGVSTLLIKDEKQL